MSRDILKTRVRRLRLRLYPVAADPTVRAGTNGSGPLIRAWPFNRAANTPSVVFLSRYIDNDNVEGGQPFKYLDTNIVAYGNELTFLDKPWIAVDIPRNGSSVSLLTDKRSPPRLFI